MSVPRTLTTCYLQSGINEQKLAEIGVGQLDWM